MIFYGEPHDKKKRKKGPMYNERYWLVWCGGRRCYVCLCLPTPSQGLYHVALNFVPLVTIPPLYSLTFQNCVQNERDLLKESLNTMTKNLINSLFGSFY